VYFPDFTKSAALRWLETLGIDDLRFVRHVHIRFLHFDCISPNTYHNHVDTDGHEGDFDPIDMCHQRAWINILGRMPHLSDISVDISASTFVVDWLANKALGRPFLAIHNILQRIGTAPEITFCMKPRPLRSSLQWFRSIPVNGLAKYLKSVQHIPRTSIDLRPNITYDLQADGQEPPLSSLHGVLQDCLQENFGLEKLHLEAQASFTRPLKLASCQLRVLRLPRIVMPGNVISDTIQTARQTLQILEVTLAQNPVIAHTPITLPNLKELYLQCSINPGQSVISEDFKNAASTALEGFFLSLYAPALKVVNLFGHWYTPCRSPEVLSAILASDSIVSLYLTWDARRARHLEERLNSISALDELTRKLGSKGKQVLFRHSTWFQDDMPGRPYLDYDWCTCGSSSMRKATRSLEVTFGNEYP